MSDGQLTPKSSRLLALVRQQSEFGKAWQPTAAERELIAAVTTPFFAECNYKEGSRAGQIDARLIRWLCADSHARELIDPRGIQIDSAKIVYPLILEGKITYPKNILILDLSSMTIPFAFVLNRCVIDGDVSLYGSHIPLVDFQGTVIRSLIAQSMRVDGNVFLGSNSYASGEVNLDTAQIGGDLYCGGGRFINPAKPGASESALSARGMVVAGDVTLSEGLQIIENRKFGPRVKFRSEGRVDLSEAHIGGSVWCYKGAFSNPDVSGVEQSGTALLGQNVTVNGDLSLQSSFAGEVLLQGAKINGSIKCTQGQFINYKADALSLDSAIIGGDVYLQEAHTKGRVRCVGTHIAQSLHCEESDFINPDEVALSLDDAVIGMNAYMDRNFSAEGKVHIIGAHIGAELNCSGDFSKAELFLGNTSVRSFTDTSDEKSWPKELHLDGFTYLDISPRDSYKRLRWLQRQPAETFRAQPYLQVAKVLGEAGDNDGKTKILIAMKDKELSVSRRGWIAQLWRWPFKITAGYGYNPIQAFWEILGLSAVGWILYRRSYIAGKIVPSEKESYKSFKECGQPPEHHTKFSPFFYSLENSLPLVKLGQGDKWEPDPSPQKSPATPPSFGSSKQWPRWARWWQRFLKLVGLLPDAPPSRVSRIGISSRFLKGFLWAQILLGWLLATLFLAGISGVIKKE